MRTSRERLIAAGRVLETLPPDERLLSIRVDGKKVRNLEAARRAYTEAQAEALDHSTDLPAFLDRIADRVEKKAAEHDQNPKKGRIVAKVAHLLEKHQGRVGRCLDVEVRPRRGPNRDYTVRVSDVGATQVIQRAMFAFDACGVLPVLGGTILATGVAAATFGAVLALAAGKLQLARVLGRTAVRQAVLVGVDFIPGAGYMTASLAAATDLQHIRATPSAAEILEPDDDRCPAPPDADLEPEQELAA